MQRLRMIIKGKVQGVWYRQSTKDLADKLNIKGFVYNHSGGFVEVVAEGEKEALLTLIKFCKSGPKAAQVMDVKEEWIEATNEFSEFTIK